MQILLIDDEPLELFVSKRFLGLEFTVEGFNKLSDAVAWAKINSFDILVSDYNLDGATKASDVLRELQAIKGNTFKAFVLTNHVDNNIANAVKAAGFNDVIEKPLSLEKFKSVAGL